MSEQAFPPGSYPSMPDEVSYGTDVKGPAPSPVVNAVKLMFARAALSVLGVLVLFLTRGDLRQQVIDRTPTSSSSAVHTAVTVALVLGVVVALVFTVLYVLQVRKGRSWARIVTLVLAVLSLLGGVVGLLGEAAALSKVLSVVSLLPDLGILVLLLAPASAEYFRRTR